MDGYYNNGSLAEPWFSEQPFSHEPSEDSTNDQHDTILHLLEFRKKNPNKLIIANLNVNSIPNKFEQLKVLVQDKVDIFVITESKLDSSFPNSQFIISGFSNWIEIVMGEEF